jgi:hypothetical protein
LTQIWRAGQLASSTQGGAALLEALPSKSKRTPFSWPLKSKQAAVHAHNAKTRTHRRALVCIMLLLGPRVAA